MRKRARVGRQQHEEDSEEAEEVICVRVQSRCSLPLHAQPVPYLTVCAHICVK